MRCIVFWRRQRYNCSKFTASHYRRRASLLKASRASSYLVGKCGHTHTHTLTFTNCLPDCFYLPLSATKLCNSSWDTDKHTHTCLHACIDIITYAHNCCSCCCLEMCTTAQNFTYLRLFPVRNAAHTNNNNVSAKQNFTNSCAIVSPLKRMLICVCVCLSACDNLCLAVSALKFTQFGHFVLALQLWCSPDSLLGRCFFWHYCCCCC